MNYNMRGLSSVEGKLPTFARLEVGDFFRGGISGLLYLKTSSTTTFNLHTVESRTWSRDTCVVTPVHSVEIVIHE